MCLVLILLSLPVMSFHSKLKRQHRVIFYSIFPSVADPCLGSGAFFGIPDPTLISDSLETFFGLKILTFLSIHSNIFDKQFKMCNNYELRPASEIAKSYNKKVRQLIFPPSFLFWLRDPKSGIQDGKKYRSSVQHPHKIAGIQLTGLD